MLSDIEIVKKSTVLDIHEIAQKLNIPSEYLEVYGADKAKVKLDLLNRLENAKNGNLILVSAITPTPLGEGKSTTTIGLVDALNKIGKKAVGCLREPSLGPVFGVKGGAAGGGYAQVNPMADLNLHFTGDLHAITCANNLISACIDNHIYQGNELKIDIKHIVWERCIDLNDRALRNVIVGLGPSSDGIMREDHFNITVASEIMAILCLATSFEDLRKRVDNLIVAYNDEKKAITVKDLGITGSVMVVLKDAIKPNLIQTLENNPFFVHGGPFANIAHGCNSILATKMALKLADYVVTEAGFGADLGAEKFIDIKCREAGLKPNAVVLVATIKALKYHGKVKMENLKEENVSALRDGIANLARHIETIRQFNLPYVIALNRFESDTDAEIECLMNWAKENNHPIALSEVFSKGGKGGEELARQVIKHLNPEPDIRYAYELKDKVEEKISKIARKVYGASDVAYSEEAQKALKMIKKEDYKNFYICMAKTPLSLSDDKKLLGAPTDFVVNIRDIKISAGAKFLVCLAGEIMTMPGLPKEPLALKIDIDNNFEIYNLS